MTCACITNEHITVTFVPEVVVVTPLSSFCCWPPMLRFWEWTDAFCAVVRCQVRSLSRKLTVPFCSTPLRILDGVRGVSGCHWSIVFIEEKNRMQVGWFYIFIYQWFCCRARCSFASLRLGKQVDGVASMGNCGDRTWCLTKDGLFYICHERKSETGTRYRSKVYNQEVRLGINNYNR